MREMEILYSDLHDIYDILEDNGYGAWCRTIRKAVELLKKHEEQVQSWTKQITDKQVAHASDIRDSVDESTYTQGVKTGLRIALDILKQGS